LAGKLTDKIVRGDKVENLDQAPFPDFSLIKESEKITVRPVMTSRGCTYGCNFCSVTEMFGQRYRTRSVENVIAEIIQYKNGTVFFVDDHFVVNPLRTDRLLDAMIASGFNRKWSAQLRTEVSRKPNLVAKMKRAGCDIVYIGFESVNPQSLLGMKKGQTVEDIRRSIRVFKEHGIMVHGMFMLGNDSDTRETFALTSDFCRENGIDFVQYTILTPLPGTELFRKLEKEGRLLHRNWEYYDALHTVFRPANVTADELQQGMIECFSDFYTYANAANDALNAMVDVVIVAVKKLYSQAYFPSLYPSLVKIFGRGIVRKWIKYNRPYLRYLSGAC
jgi:radical SAM superfamily enzyme YgiQ (UPF0313 family)